MLFAVLPAFITEHIRLNPWMSSSSPNMFLSQGGTVDSAIWNRLENHKTIHSYKRAQSISVIPRKKSYGDNKRRYRSGGSKHERKLATMGDGNNQSPFKT